MTKDQFLSYAAGDFVNRKVTLLFGDRRMKDHLEQQIAELFFEIRNIAGLIGLLNGIESLVRLFEQVLCQRRIRLLAVPRAAARSSQASHYRDEFIERLGH